MKYKRMRELLLSDERWYRSFSYHWHYDVSLDEFYKFLEQVLDEFQIPHAILNDFRNYAREQQQKQRCFSLSRSYTHSIYRNSNPLVLRI